jgi:sugar lactone lactonase YvrE
MQIQTMLFCASIVLPIALLPAQDKPATAKTTPTSRPTAQSLALAVKGRAFRWDTTFAKEWKAPQRASTHGHLLVDAKGRVYANTDGKAALTVFGADGVFERSMLEEWKGGMHGMCFDTSSDKPVLVLAHTRRNEVAATTIDGKILWTIPWPEASGLYKQRGQYHPTSVAVAKDGRIFVADGYGQSWVHIYDAERRYQKSFGGRGQKPGQMRTPHGLLMTTVDGKECLIVCDRENHRLQLFDLDGKLLRVVKGMLRRPCNIARYANEYAIADLTGRVTLLDEKFQLLGHLGEQPNPKFRATNQVARENWKDGEFLSPHGVAYDGKGNLYVSDWSKHGRVTKLIRVASKVMPAGVKSEHKDGAPK